MSEPETAAMTDIDWEKVALSALSSLTYLGVDVGVMLATTPEVLAKLDAYLRDETAFS